MTTQNYRHVPKSRPSRPETWKSGPDEQRHDQYHAWLRHRAQANFRKESYSLTFEDWVQVWADQWNNRGRVKDSIMLVRINYDLGWELSNIELITRKEHGQRQAKRKYPYA